MGEFKANQKYMIKISDVTMNAPQKLNEIQLELNFINTATPTPVPDAKKGGKKK